MILSSSYAFRFKHLNDSDKDYGNFHDTDISRIKYYYLPIAVTNDGLKASSDYIKSSNETIRLDNESALRSSDFASFWNDPNNSCNTYYKCTANFSTGWDDNTSIQISTINDTKNMLSSIIGKELPVKSKETYKLVSHMRLNDWSVNSRVDLEGFNETSKHWYQIEMCPPDSKGPLEWKEFRCVITIEANVTKIRPILNAGWSSQPGNEAITWFDSLYLTKFKPFLTDPNLKAEVVYHGLDGPINMAFLGPNDFLVIENKGTVQRIVNGSKVTEPLLALDVKENQGLLGLTIQKNVNSTQSQHSKPVYVFLYYTGYPNKDNITTGVGDARNYLDRYEFVNNKLVNPKHVLTLPAEYDHNGGPILFDQKNQSVYISIGDLENELFQVKAHKALNNKTGETPDGSGGILRITLDGKPVLGGLLGKTYPLNLYYAYGIRESFGMDIDPITGILWDTENGPNWGDEINLVEPGFNSGWNKVQGIWRNVGDNVRTKSDITYNPSYLVNFGGKGNYRSPEFTWNQTVGPTALKFLSTDKLGKQYVNDMLVADVNNGNIYHFKLNDKRDALLLKDSLSDKVANTDKELNSTIFARGLGLITDLEISPDGYLYVVVYNEGKIYKISPSS